MEAPDTGSPNTDNEVHEDIPSIEPIGYQWPASRLSSHDMKRLCIIRHAINKPITRLLQDAVQLLWEATEVERKEAHERVLAAQAAFRARCEARLKGENLALASQQQQVVAEESPSLKKTTEAL